MTVAELKEALTQVPGDWDVMVEGCTVGTCYRDKKQHGLNLTGLLPYEIRDYAPLNEEDVFYSEEFQEDDEDPDEE
jgi:hypothetical protein